MQDSTTGSGTITATYANGSIDGEFTGFSSYGDFFKKYIIKENNAQVSTSYTVTSKTVSGRTYYYTNSQTATEYPIYMDSASFVGYKRYIPYMHIYKGTSETASSLKTILYEGPAVAFYDHYSNTDNQGVAFCANGDVYAIGRKYASTQYPDYAEASSYIYLWGGKKIN